MGVGRPWTVQYTVKKVSDLPVPSQDVTVGDGKIANLFLQCTNASAGKDHSPHRTGFISHTSTYLFYSTHPENAKLFSRKRSSYKAGTVHTHPYAIPESIA
jgi:hypothetical protein